MHINAVEHIQPHGTRVPRHVTNRRFAVCPVCNRHIYRTQGGSAWWELYRR